MARYRAELGVFGNIKQLFEEATKTNRIVGKNKTDADITQASNENIMCELDSVDRIAEIEEALCELDERLGGING